MYKGKKVSVIITAAGSARRMLGRDKIFMDLDGTPALFRLTGTFDADPLVDCIVLVLKRGRVRFCMDELKYNYHFRKVAAVIPGSGSRPYSVREALNVLPVDTDIVLVQDGARPFTTQELTDRVIEAAYSGGAAVPAVKVKDTIKTVAEKDGRLVVTGTPDRASLRAVQTPQGFRADIIYKAYGMDRPEDDDDADDGPDLSYVTDDASLAEAAGYEVTVVAGDEDNIKITTPSDIERAASILKRQKAAPVKPAKPVVYAARTGTGFDVHAFAENRRLVLGGVTIPYELGLAGHSDADVLVHAVMDALLGACAMRDIGYYFPDTSDEFKDADSIKMLERVGEMLREQSYEIINIDSTVIAQKPKLAAYIQEMKTNIADALGLPEDAVGVKATTTEKLGFTGRGEGIAAQASASVIKRR